MFVVIITLDGTEAKVWVMPHVHPLMIQFVFGPSPRLRYDQFDPMQHGSAIYSIH